MAERVADLEARLTLDDLQFIRGLRNAQNTSQRTTNSMGLNFLNLKSVSIAAFAAIAYKGLEMYTKLGKSSIEYVSNLKELDNVLQVTFGESANRIALQSDIMADKMGRSVLQMRQMTSSAGALGKGLGFTGKGLEDMSTKLAQVSVDMGSFFNVTDDEAWTAIKSGITGRICLAY